MLINFLNSTLVGDTSAMKHRFHRWSAEWTERCCTFIDSTMSSSMNFSTMLLQTIEMLWTIFAIRLAMYPGGCESSWSELFFLIRGRWCGPFVVRVSFSFTTSSEINVCDKNNDLKNHDSLQTGHNSPSVFIVTMIGSDASFVHGICIFKSFTWPERNVKGNWSSSSSTSSRSSRFWKATSPCHRDTCRSAGWWNVRRGDWEYFNPFYFTTFAALTWKSCWLMFLTYFSSLLRISGAM